MSEECDSCGNVPPQTKMEEIEDHVKKIEDEFVLGHSLECSECGARVNPLEYRYADSEEEDEDYKFLEEDSLSHGMD